MPDGAEGAFSLSRMWGALAYEIKMYFTMRATHANPSTSLLLSGSIANAIAESTLDRFRPCLSARPASKGGGTGGSSED